MKKQALSGTISIHLYPGYSLLREAGPDTIEIVINKKLQHFFGVVSQSTFLYRFEDEHKIFPVDTHFKKINDAQFVVLVNNLVERLGKSRLA